MLWRIVTLGGETWLLVENQKPISSLFFSFLVFLVFFSFSFHLVIFLGFQTSCEDGWLNPPPSLKRRAMGPGLRGKMMAFMYLMQAFMDIYGSHYMFKSLWHTLVNLYLARF